MALKFCPGASFLKQPKPETFSCECGIEIEIWSDEIMGICPSCKKTIFKDIEISCIEWCKYAEECVGKPVYDNYMQNRLITVKQKILKKMEEYFNGDIKRINHARRVLHYTEEILKKEDSDPHIVIPAAILHDIGIKGAEQKYNSSTGKYQRIASNVQEIEGPAVARQILKEIGIRKEHIEEICDIIANHHSPGKINTQNFKVLYDAYCLVNINEIINKKTREQLQEIINKMFLTKTGKMIAKQLVPGVKNR